MRLIDVDELNLKDMEDGMLDVFDILEAPTIEAIPIEWLENRMRAGINFALYDRREGTME